MVGNQEIVERFLIGRGWRAGGDERGADVAVEVGVEAAEVVEGALAEERFAGGTRDGVDGAEAGGGDGEALGAADDAADDGVAGFEAIGGNGGRRRRRRAGGARGIVAATEGGQHWEDDEQASCTHWITS